MNIDEEPQIAEAEKIEVIPTLVLYRNGKAIDSIVGIVSRWIGDGMPPYDKDLIKRFSESHIVLNYKYGSYSTLFRAYHRT